MSEDFCLLTNEETESLLSLAQSGSEEAKERLINSNYPLIKSIVKRFIGRGVEYDDLYQLGCVGFVKAINNFDPKFAVKFSTYAVPMIAGEIKRFMRDDGMVKVSRSIKTLAIKISQWLDQERKKNNSPTIQEIAEKFEVEKEDVVFAMESTKCIVSLDERTDENSPNSQSLIDKIVVEGNEEKTIEKIVLKEAIETLPEKERKIIILRYFRGKTQTEIAEMLNVSQVQVSRIENKILEKIKARMQT